MLRLQFVVSQFLSLCWDVGAVFGSVFVIYGYLIALGVPPYPWLDSALEKVSPLVTLVGALAVFLSIYVQPSQTSVKLQSKLVVSPIFIAACLGALYIFLATGMMLPNSILVGLSICAIFGSLMRIVPRTHEK